MKPLSYSLRAEIFLQLARLEQAGLPCQEAVATLSAPSPAAPRLKAMQVLAARGADPAKAGEQSGLFTRFEARLVRAALIAGSPAPIYARLAEHYSQRHAQLAAMKSRLVLPVAVLAVALLVQPLPALVSGAIGIASYAWQVISPMLLIATLAVVLSWLAKLARRRVPLYGAIFVRTNLRDFFESLALLLEAGVPMLEALSPAIETVADGDIRRELDRLRRRVERQQTFASALEGVSYLRESPILAFAHTGEQSGKLPEMLARYAAMESQAIASFHAQLAAWVPRVVYALVAIKVALGIFTSGGVGPRIPPGL